MEPIVRVVNLRYRYADGTEALKGVNFELYPGECVALLGPNGAGKTTFVLHLNGLLEGEGEVFVCGLDLRDKANLPVIRRKVGLLFQDPDDQLFMPTVLEDVAFGLLNLGWEPARAKERALEALRAVGMEGAASRAPYHLSAGEKRRVALAGVLVMEPEILVLDEPTTFLDPPGQRKLTQLLQQLPLSRILVTHNLALARALANRAVFFLDGQIVAEGTVDELVHRFDWWAGALAVPPLT